jgi:hypothetical protein
MNAGVGVLGRQLTHFSHWRSGPDNRCRCCRREEAQRKVVCRRLIGHDVWKAAIG